MSRTVSVPLSEELLLLLTTLDNDQFIYNT